MNRKKYAGPLPESAVTVSICDSCSTHTVALTAAMMDSASARLAAPTLAGAYKSGGAEAVECRPVGHGPHDGNLRAEPACERRVRNAGRHRHHQRLGGDQMRAQAQRHRAHLLRFDRQDDDLRAR